jgi:hypothetical protein
MSQEIRVASTNEIEDVAGGQCRSVLKGMFRAETRVLRIAGGSGGCEVFTHIVSMLEALNYCGSVHFHAEGSASMK